MESVLHSVDELQRLVGDLVTSRSAMARDSHETDCDQFLGRIETYVTSGELENEDFLRAKLAEIDSYMRLLLRANGDVVDLSRYEALATTALNALYRNIKHPQSVVAVADDGE